MHLSTVDIQDPWNAWVPCCFSFFLMFIGLVVVFVRVCPCHFAVRFGSVPVKFESGSPHKPKTSKEESKQSLSLKHKSCQLLA